MEVAAALEVWVPAAECYCQRPSTYLSAPLPPARTSWPRHADGPNSRPGDWTCPSCGANVFASKMSCFKCQAPKPVQTFNPGAPPMGGMGGGGPPPGRDVRPGDWTCPNCEANVFASKNTCFRCNTPKPRGGQFTTRCTSDRQQYLFCFHSFDSLCHLLAACPAPTAL